MISNSMSKPVGTSDQQWALFCAAADGDLPAVKRLVQTDPELMHHQIWYEFPIHFAVRERQFDVVQYLLEAGSNPARSNFTYSSWQSLLPLAKERRRDDIHELLVGEMRKRFNYSVDYKPVWDAIKANDVDELTKLFATNPRLVHIGDEHGNRAIHWAILCRRIPVIQMLLDAGADINAKRADLQTPLHISVVGDYWYRKQAAVDPDTSSEDVTDFLLANGADYEFCVAIYRGDMDCVHSMLEASPELATQLNESQRSPLGYAAGAGQLEIVRLLLESGADPNLPEVCAGAGKALFHASGRNDIEMMQLLIDHGASANGCVDSCGNCLSIADQGGERAEEAIQLLRKHGAQDGQWTLDSAEKIQARLDDPARIDPDGDLWSGIINSVVSLDQVDLLSRFVDRFGADPVVRLNPANGWRMPKSKEMLKALLHHGMNINARDWYGRTFLHHACIGDSTELAGWLIDHEIDIDAIDHQSHATALGLAARAGNPESVECLLERGANPNLPADADWAQPITFAQNQNHPDVVAILNDYMER